MSTKTRGLMTCFAGVALAGASAALAVDLPDPTYTWCELEGNTSLSNDRFGRAEIISTPSEFSECFYITGKLQKDCIWDRQPKCCLVEFSKPLTAFDSSGRNLGLVEEVLQVEDVFNGGGTLAATVLSDGTLRIGVTSVFDCFDGTLNGLFSNGLHDDTGEVTVTVIPDVGATESYVFRFEEGREALRLAYVFPGASAAIVECDDSTGTKEVCYDHDFYWVQGLEPRELYCITQVGGKDYDCNATDTALGWFDKNGNQQGGPLGIAKSSAANNVPEYPELCVIADDMGHIRFAISGCLDLNFNGLDDMLEEEYLEFLEEEGYILDDNNVTKGENYASGASTKDISLSDELIRLSREDFDEYPEYACPPEHGVCGCYTLKVRLNEHVDGDDDDDDFGGGGLAQRADMSGDGFVDAVDLAMLLSFWGPVQ